MNKNLVAKTRRAYDIIAKEWDVNRSQIGLLKRKLASRVRKGQQVLDVGCGNGILYDFLVSKSINYTGLDFSKKLLAIAKKRASRHKDKSRARFILGEVTNLPFKENTFDWVFVFAVYHHLPTIELRQQAIDEAWRVLKPGSQLVLTVWNLFSKYAQDKYKLKKGVVDVFISWKATAGRVVRRYIHIFKASELRGLLKETGFKKVRIEIGYVGKVGKKERNLVAIAQK